MLSISEKTTPDFRSENRLKKLDIQSWQDMLVYSKDIVNSLSQLYESGFSFDDSELSKALVEQDILWVQQKVREEINQYRMRMLDYQNKDQPVNFIKEELVRLSKVEERVEEVRTALRMMQGQTVTQH